MTNNPRTATTPNPDRAVMASALRRSAARFVPGGNSNAVNELRDLAVAAADEIERLTGQRDINARCHIMAIERWHGMCDTVLGSIAEGGDLSSVIDVVADWLDGSDSIDEVTWERIERARFALANGHAETPPEADENGR